MFILILNINMQAVGALKRKAIKLYNAFLQDIQRGRKPEYKEILDLISFINLPIELENSDFIAEYLLNKNDTTYLHLGKQCEYNSLW